MFVNAEYDFAVKNVRTENDKSKTKRLLAFIKGLDIKRPADSTTSTTSGRTYYELTDEYDEWTDEYYEWKNEYYEWEKNTTSNQASNIIT